METITFHINQAIGRYGISPVTSDYTASILGYSSVYLLEKVLEYRGYKCDKKRFNEILDLYHKSYQDDVTYLTKPYDGIIDMLLDLKKRGFILGTLSNKPEHTLSVLFNEIDFNKYFDYTTGQIDAIPKKPDPHMVLQMMDKYSLDKKDVCFIGDTEVDFNTAKNAGIDFIAVTWGFRTRRQIEDLNPKYIVEDIEELKNTIINLD